jgi:N-ethylmaleimide reductase
LEKVTKRVHDKGGKIFIQLWHVGRMSHPDFHNGALPLSASAINLTIRHLLQKDLKLLLRQEMTVEDIKTTVKDFQNAAINAVKAGFDGVEIHSSNGCFSSSLTERLIIERMNTVEVLKKKARIFFEVLDAVKEVIQKKKLELVLIHHYMVHLERLWMKTIV